MSDLIALGFFLTASFAVIVGLLVSHFAVDTLIGMWKGGARFAVITPELMRKHRMHKLGFAVAFPIVIVAFVGFLVLTASALLHTFILAAGIGLLIGMGVSYSITKNSL